MLNADKTEFIITGIPKQHGELTGVFPTCILSQSVTLYEFFIYVQ